MTDDEKCQLCFSLLPVLSEISLLQVTLPGGIARPIFNHEFTSLQSETPKIGTVVEFRKRDEKFWVIVNGNGDFLMSKMTMPFELGKRASTMELSGTTIQVLWLVLQVGWGIVAYCQSLFDSV